ncbi:MAG: DUF4910 domain-containing protein [Victivallaceae bacterium]|nr:DUF4910 domain-containing protein [Victivallaceae bacterium]
MDSVGFMLDAIRRIYASDRFFSYSSMWRTCATVEEIMRDMGLTQVETLRYPSDGVRDYAGWLMPLAWDPAEATLDVVREDGTGERLCSYGETPCSLALYSHSADVTAELVPEKAEDVRGKIVLIESHAPWMPELVGFIRRGAIGFVLSHIGFNSALVERPEYSCLKSEARKWQNYQLPFWEIPENPFCFSVTPADGRRLADSMGRGRVMLHARVDVDMKPGDIPLVTGFLPGETDEEIVLTGHLFEVGANDNASGVAEMLAIVRELKNQRRRRGIRLLFTHEAKSLQAYVNTLREKPDFIAGLNVDRVGFCVGRVGEIGGGAQAAPTYATPLLKGIMERNGFSARIGGITGIDASLAEPYLGAALTYLAVMDDPDYHKSSDTPERIDPEVLETTFGICREYVGFLVNAGLDEAIELARMSRDYDRDTPFKQNATPAMRRDIAVRRLAPVARPAASPARPEHPASVPRDRDADPVLETASDDASDGELSFLYPVKNYRGFFSFEKYWLKDETHPEIASLYCGWSAPAWIDDAMMWADGSRDALEIWRLLRDSGSEVDLELFRHVMRFLLSEGYMKSGCYELPPRLYKKYNGLYPVTTTPEMAREVLLKLGLEQGMKVVVHSAFSSLGEFEGGAGGFCDLLEDILTPDGTLMMPALSRYPDDGEEILFDPETTPTRTGVLSEVFRTRPGVVRSLDPTHSFAVWGSGKLDYVRDHHLYPSLHARSPLGRLEAAGGYCLILSCSAAVTFMHVVETGVGAPCLGSRTEEYDAVVDGRRVRLRGWGWRGGTCRAFDPRKIYDFMRKEGSLREAMLNRCHLMLFKLADYRKAYERLLLDPDNGCAGCPVRPRQVRQGVPSDWDFERDELKETGAFTGTYVPKERK